MNHTGPRNNPRWITVRILVMMIASALEGLAIDREWPLWSWIVSMGKDRLFRFSSFAHPPCSMFFRS